MGRALPVSPGAPVYPIGDREATRDGRPSEPQRPPARPVSRPAQTGARRIPWIALVAGAGLLLVIGVASLYGVYSWLTASTSTPEVTDKGDLPTKSRATEMVDTLPALSPTPVDTPQPSATPLPSATPTSSEPLFGMPEARLAFVSDHRMDGKERIFIVDVVSGNYTKDQILGSKPFSQPQLLPALEPYDMAWWPDWCGGNQTIFFEAQDMDDPVFQAVAFVPSSGSGSATSLSLPGLGKLGVPRCSHAGNQVMLSALTNSNKNIWELYRYDMSSQSAGPVGSGYSLAGYSSWARDDSWLVYMDKNNKGSFYLLRLNLSSSGADKITVPASVTEQKYPSVSPANGDIAFACYDNSWNLCRVDQSLGSYQVVLTNLVDSSIKRAAPKRTIPAITPVWSPDGIWLAYASNKDGDWDIYLYSPALEIELNLTQGLGGDQFQPAWSKP